ncbi:zinc finger protein 277 [Aplysia californica]|uniref:Zinc finger protein 277 n=1 Tax=Aplysia californica TaxID=6500 RepID=A0ABM1A7G6_APLCA|nr:zinc finger protein 277 [Aplysia californica]
MFPWIKKAVAALVGSLWSQPYAVCSSLLVARRSVTSQEWWVTLELAKRTSLGVLRLCLVVVILVVRIWTALLRRPLRVDSGTDVGEKPVLETLTFGSKDGSGEASPGAETVANLPCPQCSYVSDSKEDILAHLILTHKFLIADVNFVANLSEYLSYWKKRLEEKPLSEFCSKIVTNSGTKDEAPKEEFYLLCDALPEDKKIRESLQRKKLEAVLAQQQKEREETKFCRQCLFCKQTFCGNRAVLFDHLLRDHSFHMGQADNLVFTNELFDLIQFKLDSQLCLFCEKSFKDKASLREHMRKKQHRKINPKNKEYDQFYIINYMEMGKNWESLQSEDNRPVSNHEKPANEEEEWSGWTEDSEPRVVCLFCDFSCPNQSDLLAHMKEKHGFDLQDVNQKLQLNFYQKVKLINYIRRQVSAALSGARHAMCANTAVPMIRGTSVWDQPQYFFPTYEDDTLLCQLDDDDEGAAGDALGVTVIAEEIPLVRDSILTEKLCRELQKAYPIGCIFPSQAAGYLKPPVGTSAATKAFLNDTVAVTTLSSISCQMFSVDQNILSMDVSST